MPANLQIDLISSVSQNVSQYRSPWYYRMYIVNLFYVLENLVLSTRQDDRTGRDGTRRDDIFCTVASHDLC